MPPLRLAPLLLVAAGCTPATGRPPAAGTAAKHGTATESLKVGTQTRDFRLVVPKVVDLTKPAPLVFAFHGIGTDSTDLMPRYTKLDELAAAKGFVLVYPAAVGRSWGIAPDKVKADLAFFDALLAHLTGRFKIDADRVYVLGMSNGGYFAHLIGAERSKVVAVASHSGPLGLQTLGGVNAARKFPVMIVHGDQGQTAAGGVGAREPRQVHPRGVRGALRGGARPRPRLGDRAGDQRTAVAFFERHPRR